MPIFKKKFSHKKGGHFEFSNFSQNCKTYKNAYISKTVLDRAISPKFLTHRVSLQSSHVSQGQNEIHLVNETNVLSGVKLYLSVCNQHIIIQNKTPAFTYNYTMQAYKSTI